MKIRLVLIALLPGRGGDVVQKLKALIEVAKGRWPKAMRHGANFHGR